MDNRDTPMYRYFRSLCEKYPPDKAFSWGDEHWPEIKTIAELAADGEAFEREKTAQERRQAMSEHEEWLINVPVSIMVRYEPLIARSHPWKLEFRSGADKLWVSFRKLEDLARLQAVLRQQINMWTNAIQTAAQQVASMNKQQSACTEQEN